MPEKDLEWTLSMLGLAKKAGRLVVGTPQVCGALQGGGVHLVLYSSAASENTKKRILDRSAYYGVHALPLDASPETLAARVGKTGAVAALAVADAGFARAIETRMVC